MHYILFDVCVTPLFKWWKFQWNSKSGRNSKKGKEMQRTCQRKVCKEVKLVARDCCVIYVCLNVSGNAAIKNGFLAWSFCAQMIARTHTHEHYFPFHSCTLMQPSAAYMCNVYISSNTREREKWKTFLIKSFVSNVTCFFLVNRQWQYIHPFSVDLVALIVLHVMNASCLASSQICIQCLTFQNGIFAVWNFLCEFSVAFSVA